MSLVKWVDGQAFADYEQWECHRSGFHRIRFQEDHARKSAALYTDFERLQAASARVLAEWPVTVAVHLSQKRNYRAWMGHAACFLEHGAGIESSIAAYWMLTDSGRELANFCVMEAVNRWRQQHAKHLQNDISRIPSVQLEFRF
jgi:hypothetical protein